MKSILSWPISLIDLCQSAHTALKDMQAPTRHATIDVWKESRKSIAAGDVFEPSQFSNLEKNFRIATQLREALEEWPPNSNQRYCPIDQIKRIIKHDSIGVDAPPLSQDSFRYDHARTLKIVVDRYPKIFAILALCGETASIHDFIKQGIDDTHLPLGIGGNGLLSFKPSLRQKVNASRNWKKDKVDQFSSYQKLFLVPVFRRSTTVQSYVIAEGCTLPYTYGSLSSDRPIGTGGYGVVFAVEIHPAHFQDSEGLSQKERHALRFAIKRIQLEDFRVFQKEKRLLKRFRGARRHPHLVELIATYEDGKGYHLMFPLAKCDLTRYWSRNPTPRFSAETLKWFLDQVKGLVSAIQLVHGYKNTTDAISPFSFSQISQSSSFLRARIPKRQYIRHGDIKGDNVLCYETESGMPRLVLCDFGISQSYDAPTELRPKSRSSAGTAAYASPESVTCSHDANNSRAYDMWGLGCVYLQFVIWLVYGLEGLETFNEERKETFFEQVSTNRTHPVVEFGLNKAVDRWIRNTHKHARCSKFIHEFLDLITQMLIISPKERINCVLAHRKLSEMKQRSELETGYLTQSCPR